ncbi:hypothetical protein M427DRAFT_255940 [Gonapodya prolifera JEL478]|uniref:EF-hand domain-containing protein n=1 Tax=Gonapodya prolifera (strain JEL478) TaxID=1344416 RepID=A0A139ALJ7_GONPJ|nr:hypothetical protein M427DRAFT_255940 [Gonapodya prolifera JEL478]|eukprot:KXS17657.1 hypothetical protein M427DRAFT_255940 [Gonapodya prolifera JEL478]
MWGDLIPLAFIQHSNNPARYWCALSGLDEHDFSCYLRGPEGLEKFLAVLIGAPFGGMVFGLWRVDPLADVDALAFQTQSTLGLNSTLHGSLYVAESDVRTVPHSPHSLYSLPLRRTSPRLTALSTSELRALFHSLDANGDGLLDFVEIMGSYDNWDHHKLWKIETLLDRWRIDRRRVSEGRRTYGDGFGWWSDYG